MRMQEENPMMQLKSILREITKSKRYDGLEARGYYNRLTKTTWNRGSLNLYEESLLRDEFVVHNTILAIFTDMDKQTEEEIKEEENMTTTSTQKLEEMSKRNLRKMVVELGFRYNEDDKEAILIKKIKRHNKKALKNAGEKTEKKGQKGKEPESSVNDPERERNVVMKDEPKKNFREETKKDLQEALKRSGITFRVRDTKETLIKLLKDQLENTVDQPENTVDQSGIPNRVLNMKVERDTTLKAFINRNSTLSNEDVFNGVCVLCKQLQMDDYGGRLLSSLNDIMKKEMENWILAHTIEADEQNRKYVYIKKLKYKGDGVKEPKEVKTHVVSSEVIKSLKGVVLTRTILSGLDWVTLKKLAKDRDVESFGKSRKFIVNGLLHETDSKKNKTDKTDDKKDKKDLKKGKKDKKGSKKGKKDSKKDGKKK